MSVALKLYPPSFFIQLHITERCNWQCSHCYQEKGSRAQLSLPQLRHCYTQCARLMEALRLPKEKAFLGITGGEPFAHPGFFRFLEFLYTQRPRMNTHLITNGSFITDESARDLKRLGIKSVQLSIEGFSDTNDAVRGSGAFQSIIKAIGSLRRQEIAVFLSLMLSRSNAGELERLVSYARSRGVRSFSVRRYVPMGRGKALPGALFTPEELRECYLARKRIVEQFHKPPGFYMEYWCDDAIAYPLTRKPRSCGVLNGTTLNINARGDISACRRLPIVAGNILRDDLVDIYFSSDILWKLRAPENAHPVCRGCRYFRYCKGGAKCLSLAYFGDPFAPDPQCFTIFKSLPRKDTYGRKRKTAVCYN